MAFELRIKNIGKLTDAKIRIGRFTVLAGPNNTGKSFVSKILYSLFNAMNANHAEVHINNLTKPIRSDLNELKSVIPIMRSYDKNSLAASLSSKVEELEIGIEKLEILVKDSLIADFEELDKIIPELVSKVENMQEMPLDFRSSRKSMTGRETPGYPPLFAVETFDRMKASIFDNMDAKKIIVSGIKHKISENLIQNFQVPKISALRGREKASSEVDIENIGKFEFSNGGIEFNIAHAGLRQLQQYSKVIYLESPVYWKLKNALEDNRLYPRYLHNRRERISGVPGYFYDLASALKYQYTGDMAFPELYERLTGKDVIGGKIAISEGGDLSFQENGRNFSLPVTAMGIANLGILALLIERKVLDEGSFLFIDEPEAHLHPAWQVVMAESLFELAKGGVNVVIATHSADILKFLEVAVKKNPEYEELVALNHFSHRGVIDGESDFDIKLARIKQQLTKPFSDLYIKGLL